MSLSQAEIQAEHLYADLGDQPDRKRSSVNRNGDPHMCNLIETVAQDIDVDFDWPEQPDASSGLIEGVRLRALYLFDHTDRHFSQLVNACREELEQWADKEVVTLNHSEPHVLELVQEGPSTRIVFTVRKDGGVQQWRDIVVNAPLDEVKRSWMASGAIGNDWDKSAPFINKGGYYNQLRTWDIPGHGTMYWNVVHVEQPSGLTIPFDSCHFVPES